MSGVARAQCTHAKAPASGLSTARIASPRLASPFRLLRDAHARRLRSVRLLSPRTLNAPLWLGPGVESVRTERSRGNLTYCARRKQVAGGQPRWEPLSLDAFGGACWRNEHAFACHGYGFLSAPKIGNLTRHREMFAGAVQRLLASHWPTLRTLLAARGDEPDGRRAAIAERLDQISRGDGSECSQVAA